ncbi:MAG: ADP-forming succinate--CoA ligase subunit beta [Planctomycetota bacterium]
MKIHEYQAKTLFDRFAVPFPDGQMADSIDKAVAVYRELGSEICVVKCQIHAGGRGKGKLFRAEGFDPKWITIDDKGVPHLKPGAPASMKPSLDHGVVLVKSSTEVSAAVVNMLGHILVTKQTGPEGKHVNRVLIETGCKIARELYVAITVDRAKDRVCLMVSAEGGMDIEVVAHERPDAILKEWYLPDVGLWGWQAREMAFRLGLKDKREVAGMTKLLLATTRLFGETDASLIEINPCVVTDDHEVIALDAKITFDDNAHFRHKDMAELRDLSEELPAETRAHDADLSYIKLDGDIGCLVNGAGLAMSTMDIIKLHGGETHGPANFLDVGGGADAEKVQTAFEIILADPNVKAILVNIFGGIMRCDTIAEGVVAASKAVGLKVPLVVRLEGNMRDEGKAILNGSGLNIIAADDMTDAAKKVVAAVA